MPIPKKNQLVGLDIGSHSIKLVEIDDSKRGKILKNFGIIGLPKDAIVEGTIKEIEIVASAIKNLYKNLNVKNKNVATSISGFSVESLASRSLSKKFIFLNSGPKKSSGSL